MKKPLILSLPVLALAGYLATVSSEPAPAKPSPATEVAVAGQPSQSTAAPEAKAVPLAEQSLKELVAHWNTAKDSDQLASIAEELAARNTTESVQLLVQALYTEQHWSSRAQLAQSLRAVSNPDTLAVLLPELLTNHGRGSTVLSEIVDAIARMAQPDTVQTLEVMHWQASTQAGQGHKVLRAVASIRNPSAKRALGKLAAHAESPALAAAAQDAYSRL